MSVIKFELKEDHIKLLKNLNWAILNGSITSVNPDEDEDSITDKLRLFGGEDMYDGMNLILHGKPESFDPLNTFEPPVFTEEEKEYMDKLYSELPLALNVVLSNQSFEAGIYKTKFHVREWKKIS